MIIYLLSILGNVVAVLLIMLVPVSIYLFIKETIRQYYHKAGYVVYTEKELEERGLLTDSNVIETEAFVLKEGDEIVEVEDTSTNEFATFEKLKELCEASKRKNRR